jgi:hypothetical protein
MLSAGVPGAPAPAAAYVAGWQRPPLHVAPPQECEHVPQLPGSVCVSTQDEPHTVWPVGQPQEPPPPVLVQTSPLTGHAPQVAPPLPQRDDDWPPNDTQALPLQQPPHPVVVLQTHCPLEHVAPGPQAAPHDPQLSTSLEKSAQPALHGL